MVYNNNDIYKFLCVININILDVCKKMESNHNDFLILKKENEEFRRNEKEIQMNKPICYCEHCKKRFIGCHSKCITYQEYRKELNAFNKEKHKKTNEVPELKERIEKAVDNL